VNLYIPKFRPKVIHPRLFECQRHFMANCGQMVRDRAMDTMESL